LHSDTFKPIGEFGKVKKSAMNMTKEKNVFKTIGWFLAAGFAWLFLFSFPIGQGKTLYKLGQHFIIKTAPVQWMGSKIIAGYEATLEATDENNLPTSVRELPEKLSRR
jgi:hypothetical protein